MVSIAATPAEVRRVLTNLDEIHRWFPLPFDVIGPHKPQLRVGQVVQARGKLAGKTVDTSIKVLENTPKRVHVQLQGPVIFTVDARLAPEKKGCQAQVSISCASGGGLKGHILNAAAQAVLAGGGLNYAISHVRARAERCRRPTAKVAAP